MAGKVILEDLQGKVALITGGTRGIGRAISAALAEAGCDVVMHVRRVTDDIAGFADALGERFGVKTTLVTGDFLNPGDIEAMFLQLDRATDRLDILINNAGFETADPIEEIPFAGWQDILQVNLNAPFQCGQEAARRMKLRGSGVIINISSIHDTIPRKGLASYCVAKAGLRMLGHCAALEWAEYGIRVINVCPGAIETDMNREAIEEFGREQFEHWIPAGRLGNTDDVGGVVRFLCSDASAYITGTDIYIDGGYMKNLVRYDGRSGRS